MAGELEERDQDLADKILEFMHTEARDGKNHSRAYQRMLQNFNSYGNVRINKVTFWLISSGLVLSFDDGEPPLMPKGIKWLRDKGLLTDPKPAPETEPEATPTTKVASTDEMVETSDSKLLAFLRSEEKKSFTYFGRDFFGALAIAVGVTREDAERAYSQLRRDHAVERIVQDGETVGIKLPGVNDPDLPELSHHKPAAVAPVQIVEPPSAVDEPSIAGYIERLVENLSHKKMTARNPRQLDQKVAELLGCNLETAQMALGRAIRSQQVKIERRQTGLLLGACRIRYDDAGDAIDPRRGWAQREPIADEPSSNTEVNEEALADEDDEAAAGDEAGEAEEAGLDHEEVEEELEDDTDADSAEDQEIDAVDVVETAAQPEFGIGIDEARRLLEESEVGLDEIEAELERLDREPLDVAAAVTADAAATGETTSPEPVVEADPAAQVAAPADLTPSTQNVPAAVEPESEPDPIPPADPPVARSRRAAAPGAKPKATPVPWQPNQRQLIALVLLTYRGASGAKPGELSQATGIAPKQLDKELVRPLLERDLVVRRRGGHPSWRITSEGEAVVGQYPDEIEPICVLLVQGDLI